jgi:DNA transposition AAA+ family ATPase
MPTETVIDQKRFNRMKEELRYKGGHVYEGRQTGKTQAILEVVHEFGAAQCCVVEPSLDLAHSTRNLWRKCFGDEQPPVITSSRSLASSLVGNESSLRIFVDEEHRCPYEDLIEIRRAGTIWAAVN